MVSIFDFINYREYIDAWIKSHGERSYGMKGRIAEAIKVSSSLVSQILKGEKTLTPDQASDLSEYLRLNDIETDYFHLLVEFDRAGGPRYKGKLQKKISTLQEQSRSIGKRVPRNKELTDEQRAIYYSSWLYTGIRNLTAVPQFESAEAISKQLGVEIETVNRILRFLLKNGLCVENEGRITYGPAATHVDKDSPFVNKHHQNWRLKGIQKMEERRVEDLFFTCPMSLSKEAASKIRDLLPTVVQEVMKISGPSDSEIVSCLNFDWFRF